MKFRQWFWFLMAASLCFSATTRAQTKPAGVPVSEDGPLFTAFKLLEKQPAYRMTMNMQPSDPRMAQMMAKGMGMSPSEHVVKNGVHQVIMHWKMPAMDQPGSHRRLGDSRRRPKRPRRASYHLASGAADNEVQRADAGHANGYAG